MQCKDDSEGHKIFVRKDLTRLLAAAIGWWSRPPPALGERLGKACGVG